MKKYISLACIVFLSFQLKSEASNLEEGLSIFKTLSSTNIRKNSELYLKIKKLSEDGNFNAIADLAMSEHGFYLTRVLNWSTGIVSSDTDAYMQLNDAVVSLVGSVRDNLDARLVLTGDYLYAPDERLGTKVSPSNNIAFERLEKLKRNFYKYIEYKSPQWNNAEFTEHAGILTTRGWAAINYLATNRLAVKNSFNSFLCSPNENWKTANLPTYRIRQDVDRAPAGNPKDFQTECRTCHSAMDGLAGAFSYLYMLNSTFGISTVINPKFLQNSDVYPEGYVTNDNSWINLLTQDKNRNFGWKDSRKIISGKGINSFGQMLASSRAFAKCMNIRVKNIVCGANVSDKKIEELTNEFIKDDYKLKNLFKRVALLKECRN